MNGRVCLWQAKLNGADGLSIEVKGVVCGLLVTSSSIGDFVHVVLFVPFVVFFDILMYVLCYPRLFISALS